MKELRPDLQFSAADIAGPPADFPADIDFAKVNLETDALSWKDATFDGITCMHVVEHLQSTRNFWREVARLLNPTGICYVETPHPKSLEVISSDATRRTGVTLNFFDDSTHVRVVTSEMLERGAQEEGLVVLRAGISRNWFFAAAYPILALFPVSRKQLVARLHWMGWSSYVIAQKSA